MSNVNGFVIKNSVLERYNGRETQVVVPEGVTCIGAQPWGGPIFLSNRYDVVRVELPNTVTVINHRAFNECVNLTEVKMSENLTSIGQEAFRNCMELTDIVIPNGVTCINYNVFNGCQALANITIQGKLTRIESNSFDSIPEDAKITAPHTGADVFTTKETKCAALRGFLCAPELYTDPEIVESYLKAAKTRRKELLPYIFAQDLASALPIYLEGKKVTAAAFEAEYMNPAIEANASGCAAYLLEWKHSNTSAAKK